MTNSSADLETNSMLNDSSSDEELNEIDSENGLNAMDHQTVGMSARTADGLRWQQIIGDQGDPI